MENSIFEQVKQNKACKEKSSCFDKESPKGVSIFALIPICFILIAVFTLAGGFNFIGSIVSAVVFTIFISVLVVSSNFTEDENETETYSKKEEISSDLIQKYASYLEKELLKIKTDNNYNIKNLLSFEDWEYENE